MSKLRITIAPEIHREKPVVSLFFEKDYALIKKVKSIKGATWSQSRKFWYIPKDDFKLSVVFEKLSSVAWLDFSALNKKLFFLLKRNIFVSNFLEW
jgi:hypothetical protein